LRCTPFVRQGKDGEQRRVQVLGQKLKRAKSRKVRSDHVVEDDEFQAFPMAVECLSYLLPRRLVGGFPVGLAGGIEW
jgi:hypothetical protein